VMLTAKGAHDAVPGDLFLRVAGKRLNFRLNLQAGNLDRILRFDEEVEIEREGNQRDDRYAHVNRQQKVGDQEQRDQVHPDVGQRAADQVLGDLDVADQTRDNRAGFVTVKERGRETQNAVVEFIAQIQHGNVAGFPCVVMTDVRQRRPEKDEYQDQAANGCN